MKLKKNDISVIFREVRVLTKQKEIDVIVGLALIVPLSRTQFSSCFTRALHTVSFPYEHGKNVVITSRLSLSTHSRVGVGCGLSCLKVGNKLKTADSGAFYDKDTSNFSHAYFTHPDKKHLRALMPYLYISPIDGTPLGFLFDPFV